MRFESTALAAALITPQLGQLVSDQFGPAATVVTSGTGAGNQVSSTIISASVPLQAGQGYMVTARYQGQCAGSSAPIYVNAILQDSNNLIAPGPGSAYVLSFNQGALTVSGVIAAGISTEIFPASSAPDIFTLTVNFSGAVGSSINTYARTCEITVVRNQ